MIDRELEAKLQALEEFVSNCFSNYTFTHTNEDEIRFRFLEHYNVSNQIDPEYKDYLKRLTKRD